MFNYYENHKFTGGNISYNKFQTYHRLYQQNIYVIFWKIINEFIYVYR